MPPSISLREQMLGSIIEWGNARADIVGLAPALVLLKATIPRMNGPISIWC